MIELVTAPSELTNENTLKVFLAGGIQKCEDWQKNVADYLMKKTWSGDISLINPRQPDFDMSDPLAGEKQINWEFRYLNQMDVFTMFFYGPTESDQPICFYELGRYIEVLKQKFTDDWQKRIIVTTCKEFNRNADVCIQTKLATDGLVEARCIEGYDMAVSYHRYMIAGKLKRFA